MLLFKIRIPPILLFMFIISFSIKAGDDITSKVVDGGLFIRDKDFNQSSDYESFSDEESDYEESELFDFDNNSSYLEKITKELSDIFISEINNQSNKSYQNIVNGLNDRLRDL